MYAVIQAGGHQYRVNQGDEVVVDSIPGKEGDKITLDKVLMVGGKATVVGAPFVSGAKVQATIKKQHRLDKVLVFKYKRRKNYKRTRGHRQNVTTLEIGKISEK